MAGKFTDLTDEELEEFARDPKAFLLARKNQSKIFTVDPKEKSRFESVLRDQDLSEQDFKKRLDQMMMIRLKDVDVYT